MEIAERGEVILAHQDVRVLNRRRVREGEFYLLSRFVFALHDQEAVLRRRKYFSRYPDILEVL